MNKQKGRWAYKEIRMLFVMLVISVNLYGQRKFAVKNPEGCTFVYSILPYPKGQELSYKLNEIPQLVSLEGPEDKRYKYSKMTIPGEVKWKGKKFRVKYIQKFAFCDMETENLKRIIISEGIDSVGINCFGGIHSLEQVVLPKSLKNISYSMFAFCENLIEVVIPNDSQLERIDTYSFLECSKLINFNIPDKVTTIGTAPWCNCTYLMDINVSKNNNYFETLDGVLYTKERKVLVQYPAGRISEIYVIPDGVEEIAGKAFSGTKNLRIVYCPPSLNLIQFNAFKYCTELCDIYFPNNLALIEDGAFNDCWKLKRVDINSCTQYTVNDTEDDSNNSFMPTTQVNIVENIPDYISKYQWASEMYYPFMPKKHINVSGNMAEYKKSNVETKLIMNIETIKLIYMQQLIMDLSASVNQRKDNNGRPCALLRVMIPVSGCVFSGNVIGNTDFKVNEYWVYLSEHSRYLKIQIPGCESLMLDFKLLGFSDGVESLCTYELRFEME